MRALPFILFGALLVVQRIGPVSAGVIANSVSEFSGIQGDNGWNYGFFNNTDLTGYQTSGFTPFDIFSGGVWRASDAIIPGSLNNNDFLSLNSLGGHPTGIGLGQDRILWTVRRYTSEFAGLINVEFDLRKENISEPRGGGITGRIFVDGISIYDQFIANTDGIGVQGTLSVPVSFGSKVDFAIDALGVANGSDDRYSARADGSIFSARISDVSTVPEPSSMFVFGLLALLFTFVFYRKRDGRASIATYITV